jgi:hypothetical protein
MLLLLIVGPVFDVEKKHSYYNIRIIVALVGDKDGVLKIKKMTTNIKRSRKRSTLSL